METQYDDQSTRGLIWFDNSNTWSFSLIAILLISINSLPPPKISETELFLYTYCKVK